jgi:four helix bundle protein
MQIVNFEDIIAWQKGKDLSVRIYKIFGQIKDYGFKDQIQRASVSISNNIAEGYERKSNKEFKQFLYIAKGSSGEVRSMLYIAKDLGYINKNDFDQLSIASLEIARLLSAFIKKLQD